MAVRDCKKIARVAAFTRATRHYWLSVFPRARAELGAWRRRAEQIPDRTLRDTALDAMYTKSDDLEGAVAFAVFAPPSTHVGLVRAITAFQLAFDYLDSVGELPNPDPIANGRSLNQALVTAFSPGASHASYYEHHGSNRDAGYLEALIDTCRATLSGLPSFATIAAPAKRALSRIVAYQSLNHGDVHGSHDAFADWARTQAIPGTDLHWWENGAAAGSQLSVLALIAAAADPTMGPERATALERAYFPWIGALSTLLDGVLDQRRDNMEGQRSLIDYYESPGETAERLRTIALEALEAIRPLPDADNHVLILEAMAAFFHSAPRASSPEVGMTTQAVFDTMGRTAPVALLLFRARHALARRPPALPAPPSSSNLPAVGGRDARREANTKSNTSP
jgi:tetraprenyl-beta-curcumene synthase